LPDTVARPARCPGVARRRVARYVVPVVDPQPTSRPYLRARKSGPHWYGKWSRNGTPVVRALGRAWAEPDGSGSWRRRRGKPPEGVLTEAQAYARMTELVAQHHLEQEHAEQNSDDRRRHGVTFRELASAYFVWLRDVKGAKPATLRDHAYVLAEQGTPYRRGTGELLGYVMGTIGDKPARLISTRHVNSLLQAIADTGVSARSVNKTRNIIAAAFNYGLRESTFALPNNPALDADVRREPHPGVLRYYSPQEIELIARTLADGQRRLQADRRSPDRVAVDIQDGELVRVASYTGLRLGELLALRWKDIDFTGSVLTVSRAMSAGIESTTKSGRVRRVPLPDQAAAALHRLYERPDFTAPDQFVFAEPTLGRALNPVTVRKRFKQGRDAAGARPLRFHDLRHTYGSLLAASGVDLVTIKEMMGHSALSTTGRYLHARPAGEQAAAFTKVFT
jgi:integrase